MINNNLPLYKEIKTITKMNYFPIDPYEFLLRKFEESENEYEQQNEIENEKD